MSQLVGKECKICNKMIHISIDAESCLFCDAPFHKSCLANNESCPVCKVNFVDARKQIMKLSVVRKLPQICCGCLEPTEKYYKLKSTGEGGLSGFDLVSLPVAWISIFFGFIKKYDMYVKFSNIDFINAVSEIEENRK
ncbi:hypothetical protein JXQ70_14970 [bacterium]|nr:hypothetical protein [bacterium]